MAKLVFSLVIQIIILFTHQVFAIPQSSSRKTLSDKPSTVVAFDSSVQSNGYITSEVGTHKLHTAEKKKWNDARNICLNEGAHLSVINSAVEEAIILNYMHKQNLTQGIWIGMHELFKKDDWVSVKDERFDAIGYVHWRQGEPNNAGNNEHCLVIGYQGMNDVPCDMDLFFVCEM